MIIIIRRLSTIFYYSRKITAGAEMGTRYDKLIVNNSTSTTFTMIVILEKKSEETFEQEYGQMCTEEIDRTRRNVREDTCPRRGERWHPLFICSVTSTFIK